MWIKLMLITVYISLLFVVSRLVDIALKSYELKAFELIPSYLIVNPVYLSVKHLKRILDNRGISYDGFVEKQQLRELVEASGKCSQDELNEIINSDDETDIDIEQQQKQQGETSQQQKSSHYSSINSSISKNETKTLSMIFTCGTHFYELVEDNKDSSWIILVKPIGERLTLNDKIWNQIVKKANKFGIRTGVFDCARDPLLCQSKQWLTSRILLALPREGTVMKSDVILTTYLLKVNSTARNIFNWLHEQLGKRVEMIENETEFNNNWLSNGTAQRPLFVFISKLTMPPLILSALAIKFTGRIRFGMLTVNNNNRRGENNFTLLDKERKLPLFLLINGKERVYIYQENAGENISFKSIELFLKWIKPEMNDLFYVSLVLVNLNILLYSFWLKCTKCWLHVVYWFMYFIKLNCYLFLIWLMLLALSNLKITDDLINKLLPLTQAISLMKFSSIIRYDLQTYYKSTFIILTVFILSSFLIYNYRRKYFNNNANSDNNVNDDENLFRDWAPLESTIFNYILFRQIGVNIRSPTSSLSIDTNLEEGMEYLIERLTTPATLWLQPELISNEYIKDLPIWAFSVDEKNDFINNNNNDERSSNSENETTFTSANSNSNNNNIEGHNNDYIPQVNDIDNRILHQAPEGTIHTKVCAICLENYKRQQLICSLPCGHNYHSDCVFSWLYRDNHCCPTCRWPTFKSKPKIS